MKVFVVKRKTWLACIAVAVLMLSFVYIGRGDILAVSGSKRELPIYCVEKAEDDKVVALSFDAAWGNEDTGKLIEIMDKYRVKTTFFVVGGWVDKFPESVKQLSDAGHEIMNHSDTHPHMTQISVEKMKEEIENCDKKIEKITGKKPNMFRAPYGDYDNKVIKTMKELGHYTIQWDVDSLDWKDLTATEISDRVLKKVKPGSIVLFHNAALHTPEALPNIIETLQKQGYKIVPVSEIILKDNYTIDNAGMQKAAKSDATENKAETKEQAIPDSQRG